MAEKDAKANGPLEDIIEEKDQKLNIPQKLPILLLRDIVVFPYMIVPLFVGREKSKNAIDQSLSSHRMILLLTQKDMETEDPKREEVYDMGTVALIMRMLKLPDGRIRILAQGLTRAKIESLRGGERASDGPGHGHPRARGRGKDARKRSARPQRPDRVWRRPPRSGRTSRPRS